MLRKSLIVTGIVTLFTLFTLTASASVINTSSDQFAVLANGRLSTGSGVSIDGLAGSGGNAYLGQHNRLSNSIYTVGSLSTDHHVTIDGRIISGRDVYLGHKSELGQGIDSLGKTTLGQFVQVDGNLNAGGDVSLAKSVLVNGDVSYGKKYRADRRATVTGTAGKDIAEISTWNTTWPSAPDQWTSGWKPSYYGANITETLDPGDYGTMSINNASTIYLTAGTYNFRSLWMGNGVNLIADTSDGDVIVNIVNGLSSGNDVIFKGGEDGEFVFNAKGAIYLGNNTLADANFFGFGHTLSVEENSVINGSLYSDGSIWLGSNVAVTGVGSVPEPGTCLILLTGIFAMGGWKKMKIARR